MIRKYIHSQKRKAVSARLRRAKQAKRDRLGIDAETARWRTLHPVPEIVISQEALDEINRIQMSPRTGCGEYVTKGTSEHGS